MLSKGEYNLAAAFLTKRNSVGLQVLCVFYLDFMTVSKKRAVIYIYNGGLRGKGQSFSNCMRLKIPCRVCMNEVSR